MAPETRKVDAPPGGPSIGDVLVEKYRIESVLGVGGMAVVYEAHHVQLDQPCAIKVLLPEVAVDAELVERILREARAMAQLHSEHVVRVFDVDTLESGAPYIVMEKLEGEDLEALLAANGPIDVELSANLLLQVCEALAEAHTLGIVHRDLKPANLFMAKGSDGSVSMKVLDFGISKSRPRATDASTPLTQTIMGTPMYMSPEQLRSSHDVDGRADIWSLGVILFELLTGERLFNGDSVAEICVSVLNEEPMRLSDLPVEPEIGRVIPGCLGKHVGDRFDDVAELAAALVPFGSSGAEQMSRRISNIVARAHDTSDHALSHVTSVRDIALSHRFRWHRAGALVRGIRSAAVVMASAMLGVWMGGRLYTHANVPVVATAPNVVQAVLHAAPDPGIQVEALAVNTFATNTAIREPSRTLDSGARPTTNSARKQSPRPTNLFEDRK